MKLYIFPKKDGKNKQIFHTGKHYLGEKGFTSSDPHFLAQKGSTLA